MEQIFALVNEMSPFLLLGFLFAGILHVFVPSMVYSRYLSGHSFRSVFYAALFGVPLPLCSCGVLPTAMGLRKEGASKGATVSFLIATPETGVDSIAATYSLMGLPFAIVRPITAFMTSLFAGTVINTFDKEETPCSVKETDEPHCHCHHDTDTSELSFVGKIKEALRYAFVDMMEDIGKWLVVGLLVAGLITVFVPNEFFEIFKGNTLLSMLLVLCIAIPMYICATGSIPIAVALIMKGLTPGAALVLLMAGPACNVASLLVINKFLGRRTLLLYLLSIILGAVAAGVIIDQLPSEWFMPTLMKAADCHEHEGFSWFNITCTVILAILLLNALCRHYMTGHSCCHCHDYAHEEKHCCCHSEKDVIHDCCCHNHEEESHSCCCHKE
jgi:uncharacterized membrane protein YraQ (UPF0718 family)